MTDSPDQSLEAPRTVNLGIYGIAVELATGADGRVGGTISSNLHDTGDDDTVADADLAFHAVESLILAHACEGVDVAAPAYLDGVRTAVETIANSLS